MAPLTSTGATLAAQLAAVQDVRYVIHTITFFAVSCPENSAFFRKNRQNFEKIPRKMLKILQKFQHFSLNFLENLPIFSEKAEFSGHETARKVIV